MFLNLREESIRDAEYIRKWSDGKQDIRGFWYDKI